jgi:hypothetical protein
MHLHEAVLMQVGPVCRFARSYARDETLSLQRDQSSLCEDVEGQWAA